MTLARFAARPVCALLAVVFILLAMTACSKEESPPTEPAVTTTPREAAGESSMAEETEPAPLPPDEIVQGTGGNRPAGGTQPRTGDEATSDVDDDAADAPDDSEVSDDAPDASPVALPGFVPPVRTSEPEAENRTAQPALASGLPVLFKVEVYELIPTFPQDLRALEIFLMQGSSRLDQSERESLDELLEMLQDRGVVRVVSTPSLMIEEGSTAEIEVVSMGTGGARRTMSLGLSPTFTREADTGSSAALDSATSDGPLRAIEVGFEFLATEAPNALRAEIQDLGLPIGPRASVDGSVVVQDLSTFVVVRRVVGDSSGREYMFLVTPRVMPGDFSK